MPRYSIPSLLAAAGAALALGAAAPASASTSIHVNVGVPANLPVQVAHVPAQPVYVPAQPVYAPAGQPVQVAGPYGHGYRGQAPVVYEQRAPRWDPRVRYMPGQVVWRKGELWMARNVSARVYNENSPPEWTPQYWSAVSYR